MIKNTKLGLPILRRESAALSVNTELLKLYFIAKQKHLGNKLLPKLPKCGQALPAFGRLMFVRMMFMRTQIGEDAQE